MVMPEDRNITFTNCIGMAVILAVVYGIAVFLHSLIPTTLEVVLACIFLMIVATAVIGRFSKAAESLLFQQWASRATILGSIVFAALLVLQLVLNASAGDGTGSLQALPYAGNSPSCLASLSAGHWIMAKCDPAVLKRGKTVYCQTDQWAWEDSACPVSKITSAKLKTIFKGKRVAFVGDSLVRSTFHQFISLFEPTYQQNRSFALKHSDIDFELGGSAGVKLVHTNYSSSVTTAPPAAGVTTVSFIWAPFIENVASAYKEQLVGETEKKFAYDMIVTGASYWDALHKRDVKAYRESLDALAEAVAPAVAASPKTVNIWLLPTTVIDHLLPSLEKQQHMNEEAMGWYKQAFQESKAASALFKTVINPANVSRSRESGSVDGIHYTAEVYQVIAQMVSNGYVIHFPQIAGAPSAKPPPKPYTPKRTGSMSSPFHGALMLVLTVVMLFLMDSFLGFGFISLVVCGRSFDWEAGYGPLHKKINASLHGGGGGSSREREHREDAASAETDSLLEKSSESKSLV